MKATVNSVYIIDELSHSNKLKRSNFFEIVTRSVGKVSKPTKFERSFFLRFQELFSKGVDEYVE